MIFTLLMACTGESTVAPPSQATAPAPAAEQRTVTIYSGRGESLVGELFKKMEKDLSISLDVQYGSTSEMVTRLIAEGDQSPADVVFAQDSGHLGALANQQRLSPLPNELAESIDAKFRDSKNLWLGTSGRLRVLVYNTDLVKAEELPKSLKELADPKWKGRLGWAPSNGSYASHVSALRHIWGEEETKAWLQGVQANAPQIYPKNSPQVKAAADGTLHIGWVNHYYLHKLDKAKSPAKNYSFPAEDAGNIMMVAGVGIPKSTDAKDLAEKVVAYLTAIPAQEYFANKTFEYPTRPNVTTHPDVPDIDLSTLMTVDQAHLADLGPTRVLLKELGLN